MSLLISFSHSKGLELLDLLENRGIRLTVALMPFPQSANDTLFNQLVVIVDLEKKCIYLFINYSRRKKLSI